ncbi:hypothetical protein [Streptomyces sp. NPDC047939]|uniref:hypothetical protein n=1 Tax=Streptomyces sp. NPDC047939 TaxID=3155381 RepID=UPI00342860E1
MPARRRADCRYCPQRIAVTQDGRLWPHGPRTDRCRGSRRWPATHDQPRHYWPTRHHGRRVTTIPGPDTWNPKELAA